MRKKFTIIICTLLSFSINAQITVTHTDIIDVGDILFEALDSVSGSAIQVGPSGANQTWDFSNLQQNEVNIIDHMDPNSTPFGFLHPTSNICIEDDQYIYFNKSSTSVDLVGFDDLSLLNPITLIPLPLTYGLQSSTGPIIALDEAEVNMFLPDSLAPLVTFGLTHTVDSIGIESIFENSFNVDGYGDVIVPMGTFPALRLNGNAINTTTYHLYCTDTLNGVNSGWYPMPQFIFPTEVETTYFYQWWSNDPSVKFTLVNIDVDEFGNSQGEVNFLTSNPNPASVAEEINNLKVNVFPLPATELLTIQTLNNKIVYLCLMDVLGRTVLEDTFVNELILDTQMYPSGNYYLRLESENKTTTRKIILN